MSELVVFIAFIGLQNAKIVISGSTLVQLFSLEGYNSTLAEGAAKATMNDVGITVLLAVIGVIITAILVVKNIKGNILGEFNYMDPWNYLSADRIVCAKCRTWNVQLASGLQQRYFNSES